MQNLKLNTEKIKAELSRLGKNRTWLAKQMKLTPAMVTYLFNRKPITFADRLARIFDLDPKDLLQ